MKLLGFLKQQQRLTQSAGMYSITHSPKGKFTDTDIENQFLSNQDGLNFNIGFVIDENEKLEIIKEKQDELNRHQVLMKDGNYYNIFKFSDQDEAVFMGAVTRKTPYYNDNSIVTKSIDPRMEKSCHVVQFGEENQQGNYIKQQNYQATPLRNIISITQKIQMSIAAEQNKCWKSELIKQSVQESEKEVQKNEFQQITSPLRGHKTYVQAKKIRQVAGNGSPEFFITAQDTLQDINDKIQLLKRSTAISPLQFVDASTAEIVCKSRVKFGSHAWVTIKPAQVASTIGLHERRALSPANQQ